MPLFSATSPRHTRLPDTETLKVALLAAALNNPSLEKKLLGTTPAHVPGATTALSLELSQARAIRAQGIALELFANNGRYCSRSDGVALTKKQDLKAHPLMWAVVPVTSDKDAQLFAPANDPEASRLRDQLFRSVVLPGRSEPLRVLLLPLQWEEAATLQKKFPDLALIEDGQVYRGSSPRSLFVGTQAGEQPSMVSGIEGYSLKMHLSKETYERLGGLGGNRDINFNDALFASVLSTQLVEATRDVPLIEIQSEARTVAARIGEGDSAIEVGAIFRALCDEPAVPGFAFFSKTTERLPWVTGSDLVNVRVKQDGRYLMADAIQFAVKKNPGMSKQQAFVRLFVDPLLDVNFSLFTRGWSMEMHPQNFLLKMDAKTGLTSRVVIRDLHGLGYSAAYREKHGLPDQFSVENLRKTFPDITQKDVEGYFFRNGALRDRYKPEGMFASSMDFFTSIFWYHMLDAGKSAGLFTRDEVTALVETIKDRVAAKANEHGFDLKQLPAPKGEKHDYWDADKNGIRGRILFRRAA